MTHNPFTLGLARQTTDAAIVTAAEADPGIVLRRPIKTKGQFKREASLPAVKAGTRKALATREKAKRAAKVIQKAQTDLNRAAERHRKAAEALGMQREALDRRLAEEDKRWQEEKIRLEAAIKRVQR